MKLRVLFEDNHLLVVNKNAGIATMGALAGQTSMVELAADYLKVKYNKPGNVFVGVVSRLDRLVTGVLVLARTSKAASRLSEQFRSRSPSKRYVAIVEGALDASRADQDGWIVLRDHVIKNDARHRMEICPAGTGQLAELRVRLLSQSEKRSLVEVDLLTGRKHQIRLQLSALGHPIWGDQKYGSSSRELSGGIALHCSQLTISHPTLREPLEFQCSCVDVWHSLLRPDELRAIQKATL